MSDHSIYGFDRRDHLHAHGTTDYAYWGPLPEGQCQACDYDRKRRSER